MIILSYFVTKEKSFSDSRTKKTEADMMAVVMIGGIPMQTSLDRIKPGMRAVVIKVGTEEALKQRLKDFGLVPGTAVCCRFRNPWGDVTALEFRGAVLALRTKDLRKIQVRC